MIVLLEAKAHYVGFTKGNAYAAEVINGDEAHPVTVDFLSNDENAHYVWSYMLHRHFTLLEATPEEVFTFMEFEKLLTQDNG
jgi:hypothetical protein